MTRIKGNNVQVAEGFVVPIREVVKPKDDYEEVMEKKRQILAQGQEEARKIIAEAKHLAQQEANNIIEKAREEALSQVDEIKKVAHQEGFNAGHCEGIEKAQLDMYDKIVAVNTFASSNFDIKENIIKSAEADIISLVVEIARKVCAKQFEINDDVLKEITISAIKALKEKENITIIVNPEIAQKIYSISDKLREEIPQLQSIKIIEDQSVSQDGTIVESPSSRVDCRVKSQINEIAEKLIQGLKDVHEGEV